MKEAVILAQGAYPEHPYPLHLLKTAKTLICTDGAVNKLQGQEPDWVVGDFDSLSGVSREKYNARMVRDTSEETNDLTKAVQLCFRKGFRSIIILGATGLREDHTLGNISLLGSYALMMDSVRMVTDHGVFHVFAQGIKKAAGFMEVSVPCSEGNPVSFFAFDPAMKLRAGGVLYPVEHVVFDAWWKATLNQCTANHLVLSFLNGPLLVYLPYPPTLKEVRDIPEE